LIGQKKYHNNFMPESRMTQNNSRLTNAASLSSSRNGNYYKADQMRGTGFESRTNLSLA
jgi:hypothetical protein